MAGTTNNNSQMTTNGPVDLVKQGTMPPAEVSEKIDTVMDQINDPAVAARVDAIDSNANLSEAEKVEAKMEVMQEAIKELPPAEQAALQSEMSKSGIEIDAQGSIQSMEQSAAPEAPAADAAATSFDIQPNAAEAPAAGAAAASFESKPNSAISEDAARAWAEGAAPAAGFDPARAPADLPPVNAVGEVGVPQDGFQQQAPQGEFQAPPQIDFQQQAPQGQFQAPPQSEFQAPSQSEFQAPPQGDFQQQAPQGESSAVPEAAQGVNFVPTDGKPAVEQTILQPQENFDASNAPADLPQVNPVGEADGTQAPAEVENVTTIKAEQPDLVEPGLQPGANQAIEDVKPVESGLQAPAQVELQQSNAPEAAQGVNFVPTDGKPAVEQNTLQPQENFDASNATTDFSPVDGEVGVPGQVEFQAPINATEMGVPQGAPVSTTEMSVPPSTFQQGEVPSSTFQQNIEGQQTQEFGVSAPGSVENATTFGPANVLEGSAAANDATVPEGTAPESGMSDAAEQVIIDVLTEKAATDEAAQAILDEINNAETPTEKADAMAKLQEVLTPAEMQDLGARVAQVAQAEQAADNKATGQGITGQSDATAKLTSASQQAAQAKVSTLDTGAATKGASTAGKVGFGDAATNKMGGFADANKMGGFEPGMAGKSGFASGMMGPNGSMGPGMAGQMGAKGAMTPAQMQDMAAKMGGMPGQMGPGMAPGMNGPMGMPGQMGGMNPVSMNGPMGMPGQMGMNGMPGGMGMPGQMGMNGMPGNMGMAPVSMNGAPGMGGFGGMGPSFGGPMPDMQSMMGNHSMFGGMPMPAGGMPGMPVFNGMPGMPMNPGDFNKVGYMPGTQMPGTQMPGGPEWTGGSQWTGGMPPGGMPPGGMPPGGMPPGGMPPGGMPPGGMPPGGMPPGGMPPGGMPVPPPTGPVQPAPGPVQPAPGPVPYPESSGPFNPTGVWFGGQEPVFIGPPPDSNNNYVSSNYGPMPEYNSQLAWAPPPDAPPPPPGQLFVFYGDPNNPNPPPQGVVLPPPGTTKIVGTSGDDTLTESSTALPDTSPSTIGGIQIFEGRDGNDTINAGGGNDTIMGEGGNDILNGEAGNDNIDGGAGNDTINGGLGSDTINFASGGNDIVKLVYDNTNGVDTIMGYTTVVGTEQDYVRIDLNSFDLDGLGFGRMIDATDFRLIEGGQTVNGIATTTNDALLQFNTTEGANPVVIAIFKGVVNHGDMDSLNTIQDSMTQMPIHPTVI